MPWTFYNANGQRLSSAATNISVLDIDGATALSGAVANEDLFIVDDNASGTNRKVTAAVIKTYVAAPTEAIQDDMEDLGTTNANRYVSPEVAHFHPGVAKMWCLWQADATIDNDYGVTDITDNGAGNWTVNTDVDWSGANAQAYSVNMRTDSVGSTDGTIGQVASFALNAVQVIVFDYADGTLTDAAKMTVIGFGDFA